MINYFIHMFPPSTLYLLLNTSLVEGNFGLSFCSSFHESTQLCV